MCHSIIEVLSCYICYEIFDSFDSEYQFYVLSHFDWIQREESKRTVNYKIVDTKVNSHIGYL